MRVWRLCKAEHAATAFSGEGALLYPGRWHHAGTPIVYTAESRSLAVLEQLVHLARNRLPPHFVCFGVDVPDALVPPVLPIAELPAGWRSHPGPLGLRDLGTNWAQAGTGVCLAVPSAVVPAERNFLLNPRHPDFARLAIGAPEPFALDERLAPPRGQSRRSGDPRGTNQVGLRRIAGSPGLSPSRGGGSSQRAQSAKRSPTIPSDAPHSRSAPAASSAHGA